MTIAVLRELGVRVDDAAPGTWRVEPGPIAGGEIAVEPDLSNAGPFLAAALAAGGTVRVPHWPEHTSQPGSLLPQFLTAMGAQVALDHGVLSLTGTGRMRAVGLVLGQAVALAPVLVALAAVAGVVSLLSATAHLPGNETGRLVALITEIRRL